MGVFILVIGAIAGGYLGFGRADDNGDPSALSVASAAPSWDPLRAKAIELAQAKAANAAASAAASAKKANEVAQREREQASRSETRTTTYPIPSSCNEYTGNRALGCALLLEAGFGLDQMPCLERLWTKESGWNPRSQNASSGAYGIPQALPGDKMAVYGSDWRTNPVPQIKWGLNYIKNRYQTPCKAWAHVLDTNWY
ncbi:MAG TPA: transglycosylase SLT domain-containing protein [Micromonosporaceae bacterium]